MLTGDRRGTPVTTQGQQEMVGNVTPDFFSLEIDFLDEFSDGEWEKEREREREGPAPAVGCIFVLLFSIGW